MTENYKDNTITYKELEEIINKVMEGYLVMLRAGNMSFSEFAILENVILKILEHVLFKSRKELKQKKEE